MSAFWRPFLVAALALTVLAPASAAAALDQASLEELEGLLRDLGFDPGTVDGVVDDDTLAAIRSYQDFALLPGDPAPDARLLDELRGVAAAFAALNAGKAEDAALPEKVIVPPAPPPPKLKPVAVAEEKESQVAELPPADWDEPATGEDLPPDVILDPELLNDPIVHGAEDPPVDPVDDARARIDAELLRFLHLLNEGSLTRADLARQFNAEGRELLQQAQYDEAILKFSVAIHLDPTFAGAYSNRGTAYQRQEESALAKADFEKAKELGFGGVRMKNASNPLN
ncbi:MAG: tetratricopeptide repeat protein [Kiloniellaceae bacterium]|nr:tetratricopeptide repeat protein [Kiloniellaceae bacterium]